MKEYEYASKKISTEYIDPDKKPTVAQAEQRRSACRRSSSTTRGAPNASTPTPSRTSPTPSSRWCRGQQRKVYFTQGHGEKDTTSSERDGYNVDRHRARPRELHGRQARASRSRARCRTMRRWWSSRGRGTTSSRPKIDALKKYLDKQGKLLLELDPPDKADSPPLTNLIALAHDWGIQAGNNIVVDVSGMGRLIGTDASVPVVAPPYPAHPITQRFGMMTAFPLAREASPVSGGVNGHTAQPFVETGPRSWAETDLKALMTSGEVSLDEAKGDKKGPIAARRGGVGGGRRRRRRPSRASRTRRSPKRASR